MDQLDIQDTKMNEDDILIPPPTPPPTAALILSLQEPAGVEPVQLSTAFSREPGEVSAAVPVPNAEAIIVRVGNGCNVRSAVLVSASSSSSSGKISGMIDP
jgi:hypothetical protein